MIICFILRWKQENSPPGQVFHPDIERSEIVRTGWRRGGEQSEPTSVTGRWIYI